MIFKKKTRKETISLENKRLAEILSFLDKSLEEIRPDPKLCLELFKWPDDWKLPKAHKCQHFLRHAKYAEKQAYRCRANGDYWGWIFWIRLYYYLWNLGAECIGGYGIGPCPW